MNTRPIASDAASTEVSENMISAVPTGSENGIKMAVLRTNT